MSAELIGVLGVGAALGGLILPAIRGLRTELRALAVTVAALGERVARIEGLLDGAGVYRRTDAAGD